MDSIQRPKSLTELVTEKLRTLIVSGELGLGKQLSEVKIAKELQVSRTPVREAFNRLEIEGLVTSVPQSGTFVFSLAPEELAKLCDARIYLETAAMELAMEHNAQELHKMLTSCVEQMGQALKADDIRAYLLLDTAFHQCWFDCCHNQYLDAAYQTFAQRMAAIRCRIGGLPDHVAKSYREHCEMAETSATGDYAKMRELLLAHIGRAEGSYWAAPERLDK